MLKLSKASAKKKALHEVLNTRTQGKLEDPAGVVP